mmetsp:Transcript_37919/g.107145  ORF Transcript_37919/g.107145 Transcript_37919/m.107145 type:complete len:160 (-) Transcript_37919:1733-2212(-)
MNEYQFAIGGHLCTVFDCVIGALCVFELGLHTLLLWPWGFLGLLPGSLMPLEIGLAPWPLVVGSLPGDDRVQDWRWAWRYVVCVVAGGVELQSFLSNALELSGKVITAVGHIMCSSALCTSTAVGRRLGSWSQQRVMSSSSMGQLQASGRCGSAGRSLR